jgi:hypothetical protein
MNQRSDKVVIYIENKVRGENRGGGGKRQCHTRDCTKQISVSINNGG